MPANTVHPVFQQPVNPDVKVWRYMDFAKYAALLEESALWFSRADKLGESFGDRLGDPFEGTISHATLEAYRTEYLSSVGDEGGAATTRKEIEQLVEAFVGSNRLMRGGCHPIYVR